MRRPVALFSCCLLLLFAALLVRSAPAYLLGYFVDDRQLRLSGFSGTVWNGRAGSAAIALENGWLQLGELEWSLSELYMLRLQPTADIDTQWGPQRLHAHMQTSSGGALRINALDASFSAALIKRWLPVNLRGLINVQARDVALVDGVPASGAGQIVWRQAFWRGNQGAQPLGDYALRFSVPASGQLNAEIRTLSGPIRVEGSLRMVDQQYTLEALINSRGRIDEELAKALSLMAIPTDDGFVLKFTSEL